jgi:hypothetical protein
VAAPTTRPSSSRRTKPNPKRPSLHKWASTFSFRLALGGGLQLELLQSVEGWTLVEVIWSGLLLSL